MLTISGPFKQNRQDECLDKPFIVFVGAGHKNGEWQAMLIDQDMNFASQLARSVEFLPVLPLPTGMPPLYCLPIATSSGSDLADGKNATSLESSQTHPVAPGLKPLRNDTARYSKPMPFNRLPLTATPQHKPDGIQNQTIFRSRWTRSIMVDRQKLFYPLPHSFRHFSITHVLRLCVTMLGQGVSPFLGMCRNTLITDDALYFNI